eukprot:1309071-Rhodomonas_salina.1
MRTTEKGNRPSNPVFARPEMVSDTPSIALGDEAGTYNQRAMPVSKSTRNCQRSFCSLKRGAVCNGADLFSIMYRALRSGKRRLIRPRATSIGSTTPN